MRRFAQFLFGPLLLAIAACSTLENRLVYQPTVGGGPSATQPAGVQDLQLLTASDVKIHARWCPHPQAKGAILYCHGNGGNLDGWAQATKDLYDHLGMSVLIFDYPGYGRSEGKPSEAGCYESAEAAYLWLTRQLAIPADRLVLMGESLGGAVAVEMASRHPHRALVLVRTFTSLPEVADHQMPLLVSSMFLNNRFDSLAKIGQCKQPLFLAQADADRLIPFKHGQQLFEAYPVPEKELCWLKGRGHNDPLPPEFYHALRRFLDRQK